MHLISRLCISSTTECVGVRHIYKEKLSNCFNTALYSLKFSFMENCSYFFFLILLLYCLMEWALAKFLHFTLSPIICRTSIHLLPHSLMHFLSYFLTRSTSIHISYLYFSILHFGCLIVLQFRFLFVFCHSTSALKAVTIYIYIFCVGVSVFLLCNTLLYHSSWY